VQLQADARGEPLVQLQHAIIFVEVEPAEVGLHAGLSAGGAAWLREIDGERHRVRPSTSCRLGFSSRA